MPDYAKLALTAQRLVQAAGRSVTLTKLGEVSADPAKPWRSTDGSSTAVTAIAAIVPYEARDTEGTLVRRGQMVAYVAALDGGTNKLEKFDELLDGTDKWKITDGVVINPGGTRVLYELMIKR